jgi:CHAT domain-containing protein
MAGIDSNENSHRATLGFPIADEKLETRRHASRSAIASPVNIAAQTRSAILSTCCAMNFLRRGSGVVFALGSTSLRSQREVQSAVSHFGCSRVMRYEAATRAALQDELTKYPVLHFSCHGFANFREPLEGGLVMANDQILSLRDFLSTRLPKARLAVLSACETAIPGNELPDEALSLQNAAAIFLRPAADIVRLGLGA